MTTDHEMEKIKLPLFTVDSFSKRPFSGNPAGVCLVTTKDDLLDAVKQKMAAEINVSETAFLTKLQPDDKFETANRFRLRWFTPTNEVPLCGHATLATAAVLFHSFRNNSSEIQFETKGGLLIAKKNGDKIILDMPLNIPQKMNDESLQGLIKIATGSLPYEAVLYSPTTKKLMIRLKDSVTRLELEKASPPLQLMVHAHNTGMVMGVILTLKGSQDNGCIADDGQVYDFVSRFFSPWNGVNEDPVTGSAHTVLGGYWSQILGKKSLFARQCSKRGGELWLTVADNDRIDVAGHAFIIMSGVFNI